MGDENPTGQELPSIEGRESSYPQSGMLSSTATLWSHLVSGLARALVTSRDSYGACSGGGSVGMVVVEAEAVGMIKDMGQPGKIGNESKGG